jgi:lipopolysaccharide export system protein LptA
MNLKCFGSVLAVLILWFCLPLLSQGKNHYILKNANLVKIDVIENDTITTLKGDVDLIYNEIEFFADNAQIFQKDKRVKLFGNVRAIDDTLEAGAQKATYFHKDATLKLEEEAYFIENSTDTLLKKVTADFIEYQKENKKVHALNNIIATDFIEDVVCTCGKFRYDMDTDYGLARENPVLTFRRDNELKIYSKQMELFAKEKKFTGTYDVKVETEDTQATSNFLIYFNDEEKAVMLGKPQFKSSLSTATAEEFQVFFKDEKISQLLLVKDAVIHFKEEDSIGKENYLYAGKVRMEINNDKLEHMHAQNVSRSFFEQRDGEDILVNKLATLQLEVFFDEEENIQTIIAEDDIKGTYTFSSSKQILEK